MELSVYNKNGKQITGKNRKPLRHSIVFYRHDSVTDYKQFIIDNRFDMQVADNVDRIEYSLSHGSGDEFVGGTIEECEALSRFKDPETMKALYNKVHDKVSVIQMQNVRSNVHLNDFGGEFCPDAFDAGSDDYLATLADKRDLKRHVSIVLSMGYNCTIKAEQAIYNSLAGVVFCDLLQTAGYSVDIHVVNAIEHNRISRNRQYCIVKAKQGSNYLDPDSLAILASDSRLFRHWEFQNIVIQEDQSGNKVSGTMGRAIPLKRIESDLTDFAGLDFDFIFGKCFSFNDTVQQVTEALEQVEQSNKKRLYP